MPRIKVNGETHTVPAKISVSAALMNLGVTSRKSVGGENRNPLCGMGICFECRVTVNGVAQRRGCQVEVMDGMEVSTDAI